jgi:hypothetical protein
MEIGNVLTVAIVLLTWVVLFGVNGWINPPGFRGPRTLPPLRFSLRRLLIAVTLAAASLGLVVYALR